MRKPIKKAARQGAASLSTSTGSNHSDSSLKAQRQRVLAMLRRRPRTTLELRASGVMMPATRVLELRRAGYAVTTTRVTRADADGFLHAGVALYALLAEAV